MYSGMYMYIACTCHVPNKIGKLSGTGTYLGTQYRRVFLYKLFERGGSMVGGSLEPVGLAQLDFTVRSNMSDPRRSA